MSQDKLTILRNTTQHVLTMAMEILYDNKVKKAMGPSIDDGFYFDFETPKALKISKDNFPEIESQIHKLISLSLPITIDNVSKQTALKIFKDNPYKHHWIDKALETDKQVRIVTIGKEGTDYYFPDVCKDEHLKSTGEIKAFKLLSVAGAYWLGSEKNKMLTRIYGTAFNSPKDLRVFLNNLEEAKKRDHKKLGINLDLFTFSKLVGSGLALWTPKGNLLRSILDDFVWDLRREKGYQKVEIPHITKKDLYVVSGHWDKFKDELFKIDTREGDLFCMKPMNCPHHTQIFDRKPHSYKEMPQRYCNTTMVYRDEQSGELSGLSRVRCITQDDAHVFCRKSQIKQEMSHIWDIIDAFYKPVGFDLQVRLSLSDPKTPDKYLGERKDWLEAEEYLRQLAKERGVKFTEAIGEAAFYGPKLDFMAKDSLNREWQVATNQLDLNMPNSFDLTCTNEKGEKERIVMIHAAIMGSIERYLSILIEHFAGAFPTWLSPIQVSVIPISDKNLAYSTKVFEDLKAQGIRVELDDSNSTLNAKIRNAQNQKIPHMLIIGDKEQKNETVSRRSRTGNNYGEQKINKFVKDLQTEIEKKTIN
jgi:threonyl-tRNA synthetase